MDNEEIRTLQILEQIENDESVSQRALASNLNVSLGLINSFIKRLVKKGYIKVTTIPRNRIAYLLTPKGAAEKATLTYKYIKISFLLYKKTRIRMIHLFDEISNQGIKEIAFYGANEITEIAYISLHETPIEFKIIADEKRKGEKFLGRKIIDISSLKKEKFDKLFIADFSYIDIEKELHNFLDKKKILLFETK